MQLVNIGFGNIIAVNKIVAIVSPDSAPIKRMVISGILLPILSIRPKMPPALFLSSTACMK